MGKGLVSNLRPPRSLSRLLSSQASVRYSLMACASECLSRNPGLLRITAYIMDPIIPGRCHQRAHRSFRSERRIRVLLFGCGFRKLEAVLASQPADPAPSHELECVRLQNRALTAASQVDDSIREFSGAACGGGRESIRAVTSSARLQGVLFNSKSFDVIYSGR